MAGSDGWWGRLRGGASHRRAVGVRFPEAVPRRRDRAQLWLELHAALWHVRADQKKEVSVGLDRLCVRRVPVAFVSLPAGSHQVVGFSDGTRLELDVRDGSAALERLARHGWRGVVYLDHVEPCFGPCCYFLRFMSVWEPAEVLVRVNRLEAAG